MKNLSTFFFVLLFASTFFAQTDNSERVSSVLDGLREAYTPEDYQLFLIREQNGEIPFAGGLVDAKAAADALVNNNTGSTGTSNFTQSEMSIIAFGNNVVIGFNDSGSYVGGANKFTGWSYSTNGGVTFTDGGTLPTNSGGDAGDPVLARNESTGRIYLSTLGFSTSTIQMFRSDDNGVTWMAPTNATPGGSSEDKQWHTVDNFAGTGNGNVYMISRRFGSPSGIYAFRSTDNGNTFGPSGGVQIFSGGQGAFISVGPDHSVYAFYYNGSTGIFVRRSTDFGVTFGSPVTVFSGLTGGTNGDLGLTGKRNGTTTFSSFRSNAFPHVAVNPVSGHLYLTFNNNPAGTDKGDIYFTMSTDLGATWSAPITVNDEGTTTDQWQPTIAVTPDGTNLGIFYNTRQEDTAENNLFKYAGRLGTISGSTVTWAPSIVISDVASLPEFGRDNVVNSVYMGDYQHAHATNDAFHVTWADNRDDLPGGAPRKDPNVYYEKIPIGPPCPIGQATNPNPPNGATGLPLNGNTATWTNGAGTVNVEVWFGPAGNVVKVYDGAAIPSFALPNLNYNTTYYWYIVCKDASCSTQGPSWSFTTIPDPNIICNTVDIYPQNINYWTGTCNSTTKTEVSLVNANGNAFPGWMVFDLSSIVNDPTTVINTIDFYGYLYANNYPYWSITPMGTVNPVTGTAAEIYTQVSNNYQAGVAYSFNQESGTLTNGWINRQLGNNATTHMKNALAQGWFAVGITEWESGTTYYVRFQGWAETNKPYLRVNYCYIVPVELTSFTASAVKDEVELNWTTSTETNNQGFQIERMTAGGTYEEVGFVAGFGTTTEPKSYSFVDSKLESGNYTYRLKQVDFDGTFTYSNEVNVDVEIPLVYALEQNYPNPFNPSTTIKYSIADEGFVKLVIFNMLGEEVTTLVNTQQKAGRYEVNFNAAGLSSGVYVYRLETANFVTSKKLMLMK
ncbi:MAG: T9SS type A sorting domain-containing protein [Ignavibacteriaceae bacterium]|jgi:hypothetical protein|nr:T9SS type A sorting domain-containing protein [Ignavibacteriaceae bacterium]